MQDEGLWGKTHAQAGIYVRKLCEKAPKRFSKGKPEDDRRKVCLRKILRELFLKASHGSLPWRRFYLTYLRTASLFNIHDCIRTFILQNFVFTFSFLPMTLSPNLAASTVVAAATWRAGASSYWSRQSRTHQWEDLLARGGITLENEIVYDTTLNQHNSLGY